MNDEFYMRLALDAGWERQLLTYPNPAVGAVLLDKNGRILAVAAHESAGKAHAEVLALARAFAFLSGDREVSRIEKSAEIHDFLLKNHGGVFNGAVLYVTLEPCANEGKTPACAPLIAALGITRVVISAGEINSDMAGGAEFLRSRGVEITTGVLADEGRRLIEPFAIWRKRAFVLFKWASRLNGSIDNGQISGDQALDEVHYLRSLCDELVIGGETARRDRPILDARRVDGKPPNVTIISRRSEETFDKIIPLFNVAGRRVSITRDFNFQSGFILVEGGANLFNFIYEKIDWFLCYESTAFSGGKSIESDRVLELLRAETFFDNAKLWLRKKP